MLQTVFKKLFSLREQAARRPGADDGFDPQEKPFLDHLDDLRVTLFRIITTLAISSAVWKNTATDRGSSCAIAVIDPPCCISTGQVENT